MEPPSYILRGREAKKQASKLTLEQTASSLNGWDNAMGTVTVHSYNEASLDEGDPKMGTGFDEKLRPMGSSTSPDSDEDDDDEEDDDDNDTDF